MKRIIKYIKYTLANIFCLYTHPLSLGWSQNVIFLKVVILHIKLSGMRHRLPCKQIFSSFAHPDLWGGVKRSKHIF